MKRKPVAIWIILIAAPFVAMFLVGIAQLTMRAALSHRTSPCPDTYYTDQDQAVPLDITTSDTTVDCTKQRPTYQLVVNIVSLIVGTISVLLLLGSPLWIIFLILAISHNNKLRQSGPPSTPQV